MLQPRSEFFPNPGKDEETPFENLKGVLERAFQELKAELGDHGNSPLFSELGREWGRRLILSWRDLAIRYRALGGLDGRPIKIGSYEARATVTETYLTDDPHFSAEVRSAEEHHKISISTYDGMRDEGAFPPKLESKITVSETLEIRYVCYLSWNRIALIERTEVVDSPQFDRPAIYRTEKFQVTIMGKDR